MEPSLLSTDSSVQIKPIAKDTVHKICSGQVVLSLAVAVKELVENSLDAGASNIDIRLKNYGIELIEVSDNGSGVTEDNFAALTMKYHTSKISEYADLLGVSSYGFRGEALSSLCSLAHLTITTRHKSLDYATKIEYDQKGHITKTTPCSRQIGTTVSLTNLFHTLPVRKKEFHKNVKREFNKMTQLLYAYCLISLGVKITCTNQTNSNSKSVVVATQGSTLYKDNIACIFGLKQLQSILEIKPEYNINIKENIFKGLSGTLQDNDISEPIDDVDINLSEDSNENDDDAEIKCSIKSQGYKNQSDPVEFTGFISSCAHGCGRSSTDRQFFYVNSRPCEPSKVIKIMNEVYRQYNPNQYPFIFLNINIEQSSVDINVTPDKRKVFLTKEKNILSVLKNSLLKLFENIPKVVKIVSSFNQYNQVENSDVKPDVGQPRIFNSFLQQFDKKSNSVNEPVIKNTSKIELKRKSTSMIDFISSKALKIDPNTNNVSSESNRKFKNDNNIDSITSNYPIVNDNVQNINVVETMLTEKVHVIKTGHINNESGVLNNTKEENIKSESEGITYIESNDNMPNTQTRDVADVINEETRTVPLELKTTHRKENKDENIKSANGDIMYLESSDNVPNTQIRNIADIINEKTCNVSCELKTKRRKENIANIYNEKLPVNKHKIITDREDLGKHRRRSIILKTSIDHVKALASEYVRNKTTLHPKTIKFKSEINPVCNRKCEEELSREISKDSFRRMSVIGQFNLGFIITLLDDDLFIIDQHATDEIYNFEMLQKSTELTSQKLVIPQQLELTGVNEEILIDNLDIFKKNGFTFEINENALPTKRVKLLTLPMSKNWIFGKDDIEELLFMLRESPSEYCRPSRVRAMFASRACRKSVMIGTALKKSDMKVLINHMSEIDKPWNCPHGRPTIRHLVNLAMIHTKDNSDS